MHILFQQSPQRCELQAVIIYIRNVQCMVYVLGTCKILEVVDTEF